MTRVLWLTKGLGRGGAEQLLVGSVPHVDRQRFDVEVAYLLPWKDALVPALERQRVTVHCLENRHPADLRWALKLRELVRTRDIGLVHTHMPYVAALARLTVPHPVPMVHTEHNVWDRYRLPTRWANALTYPRNGAVLAVSDAVACTIRVPRWLTRHPPPVEVVRHGADLAAIRRGPNARTAARQALGVAENDLVVGTVGNFTPKKDHATLLDAFTLLAPGYDRLRLVLIGSGPLEAQLTAYVHARGLDERVVFTGMRDDVYELLPGLDVFTLSSRYEGLPISLLEAMATGIPCVVTAVGGIPEVVTDGAEGFTVAPGDPVALAAAIDKLLTDPALRRELGERAATRSARFDLRSAVLHTQEIYDRLLAGS